jgi:hypothetical protein
MIVLWGGLALAAVAYAVVLAVRYRDPLPIAACVGAGICALNEPIYDTLANLVYARTPDSYTAYTAFGRHIPWTVVLGYIPWVGLVSYVLFRNMAAGTSRGRLHAIALGLGVSVAGTEILNAAWLHAWRYYGQSAWRGVLGGGTIQMAAMPLLCGFLFYALADRMGTWGRITLGIVVPTLALPMTFASTTWPLYVANHSSLPGVVSWGAAALSAACCVAAVYCVTFLAQRWHSGELALVTVPQAVRVAPTAPPALSGASASA